MLYKLFDFCSSWPFPIISGLYWLFLLLELLSIIKGQYKPFLLDEICCKFKNHKTKTIISSIISLLMCFFILFSSNQFLIMLGCDDIRVMPEGTYCYYVYATNEKGKTYTLPAKIDKINETYTEEDGEGIKKHSNNYYYINNVYFKNGGYLHFDSDYLKYDEKECMTDQNEKEWEIELTTNKASHSKVNVTQPFKPSKLIFPCIEILTILIATILYILDIREQKKE